MKLLSNNVDTFSAMINIPAVEEIKDDWADALDKVANGLKHLEIQRSGKEPVYMISAGDYKLFLQLLEEAEERHDLEEAEMRMATTEGDAIGFDEFFADLGISSDSIYSS